MKSLVTGCAGFIGSNLTDWLLDHGHNVIGIDCFTDYYEKDTKKSNISKSSKNPNFKLIEKNLLDIDEYPDVDYVFHMAAQAGVRSSWGQNFQTYTKNNIEVTQKLLEFYKNFNLKKFIYSSSSSVYGDSGLPMNENSLLKPISPYGVTKLAAENLCYLYWKNYGIPTISLRYFTAYGPRQRPDMAINKFVKAIANNDKITIYGDGEQTRDFTFVEDVIRAIVLATESKVEGKVFNVGGGSTISVNELIKSIETIFGIKSKVEYLDAQKGDVTNTLADLEMIKELLGWSPKIDIHEGLTEYINYYKKTHNYY